MPTLKNTWIIALLTGALCLSVACKPEALVTPTPVPSATPAVPSPAKQPAAQSTPPPAPNTDGLDGKIELLTETCLKLDSPVNESCKVYVIALKNKNAEAITLIDTVTAGITVTGNMVMLDPKVEKMLIEKYEPLK